MAPGSCREAFGEFWRVLKPGKRQPWTSIKGHCHGFRDLLELQERFTAAWVAPGSCREAFGEFWRVLKPGKRQPWTSLKGHHGLRDLLELQERFTAAWVAPGSCREAFGEFWRVLASFEAWQTAALNLLKRTLPRPQGLVGAAQGLPRPVASGNAVETEIAAWVARGKWTEIAVAWVAPGRWTESAISVWGVLASCEGWQTAALNLHKRTLPRLQGLVGAAGKVHRGLSGAWELQGSVWGVLASFEAWQTAALNLLKRTLPRPQGLVGAAGKVHRGLSGAWELQGPRPEWRLGAAGKRLGSFGEFWSLANGSLEPP